MGQIRISTTSFTRDVITDESMKVRDALAQAIEAHDGQFDEREFALRYEVLDNDGNRVTDLGRAAEGYSSLLIQEKGIQMG